MSIGDCLILAYPLLIMMFACFKITKTSDGNEQAKIYLLLAIFFAVTATANTLIVQATNLLRKLNILIEQMSTLSELLRTLIAK
jgi:predicted metal-binding membrane protein